MDQLVGTEDRKRDRIERLLRALDEGIYLVDSRGEILCTLQDVTAGKGPQKGLIAAIEAVIADTSAMGRGLLEKFRIARKNGEEAAQTGLDALSEREREVLGLICRGQNDQQMGAALGLSRNTIRNHIASLYRKIGINRRGAAIIWARERGISAEEALKPRLRRRPRLTMMQH